MYKKGLETALQAYGDFGEKQQAAIEHIRNEVRSGNKKLEDALSSLGEDIFGLYDYLNSKEKAVLYKLGTPSVDIKDLDDEEKRLLLAILYQLAQDSQSQLNENQQSFLRAVQKYLEITNPQIIADYEAIENIDSIEVQKVFLQVALEFMYLQESDEYTEIQEDFLGYFSVNRKQANQIELEVSRMFNLVGAKGLSEKYGYVPELCEDEHPEAVSVLKSSLPEEDKSHYDGIPEEIVKKSYKNKHSISLRTYNFIETKDYVVFENDGKFIKYNKNSKEESVINFAKIFDIEEDPLYQIKGIDFCEDNTGVNYNGNTFAVLICQAYSLSANDKLFFYDLNNDDSFMAMENVNKLFDFHPIIYTTDKSIVLTGKGKFSENTQIICYDLIDKSMGQLKCNIGELAELYRKDELAVLCSYVFFYVDSNVEAIDKNGNPLQNKICIGDLNTKEIYATDILEKIKNDINNAESFNYISCFFSCRNSVYVVLRIGSNHYIYKIIINDINDFDVIRCAEIQDRMGVIRANYNYIAFNTNYSICVFNTESEKVEQVAKDCCYYSTSGKLIKSRKLVTGEYMLAGQWILHNSYDIIYITDINKPMESKKI